MRLLRRSVGYALAVGLIFLAAVYIIARILPPPAVRVTPAPSNVIVDRHGELLYEWIDPAGAIQHPLPLDAMSPYCVQATLAAEDKRFYHHVGVDPIAILRSLYRHWRWQEPLTGASTLTQQLVRLTRLSEDERYERSLRRKVKEAWFAFRLERHMDKAHILEAYLNHAYYGNFAIGMEAAARAYFGQPARALDLAQCAMLAGLPQSPTKLNPLIHPDHAKARQTYVLQRMVEAGYISPEEAQRAQEEPLIFASTPFPIQAPHFVMWVQNQAESTLGVDRIRRGGWKIVTSLDLGLQERTEHTVREHLARLRHDPHAPPHRRVTSGAVVVLDTHNGDVLAMVGSPDYFNRENAGAVNGTLTPRQSGSAIKPFVYAAAFDPELPHPWAPPTLILDAHTVFSDTKGMPYVPKNFDQRWHGWVPARVALAASLNVPAVKALRHAGIARFLALAQRVGLDSLIRSPARGPALALGVGEVSLLELTRAYGLLARGGKTLPVHGILAIYDAQGRRVWERPTEEGTQVLDPRVAYLITDILADRYARIPTYGLNSSLEWDRRAAVKTGTTTDWRDAWTIGYSPDRVVGVWVGNWDNTPMMGLTGGSGAAPIWHAVMSAAHENVPRKDFPRPKGIRTVRVCAQTGLPATPDCPLVREDIVLAGVPFAWAESEDAFYTATSHAGSAGIYPTPTLPPLTTIPGVISPEPEAVYRLSPTLPQEEQMLALEVQADPGSWVTFRVDGQEVGTRDRPPYRVWWALEPGAHVATFELRLANGQTRTFRVRFRVEKDGRD